MSQVFMRSHQPAFQHLRKDKDGGISVWLNRTLLPPLSETLQDNDHPTLRELSSVCLDVFNGTEHYQTEEYSLQRQPSNGHEGGAYLHLAKSILEIASRAFINTSNGAVAKIGYEISNMNMHRVRTPRPNHYWDRRKPFLCGVNMPAQTATLMFERSMLLKLADSITDAEMKDLFINLAEILDPRNDEVDIETDETSVPLDVSELQQ